MKKNWTIILMILAILFLAVAIYYFVTPANSLLHFFPGYDRLIHRAHTKHGIAALAIAVICAIGAWLTSANHSDRPNHESTEKQS